MFYLKGMTTDRVALYNMYVFFGSWLYLHYVACKLKITLQSVCFKKTLTTIFQVLKDNDSFKINSANLTIINTIITVKVLTV